jgi:hypothetical protein
MTPEQQREVWEMLDKRHLVDVARKGPEPVFATISGAHHVVKELRASL